MNIRLLKKGIIFGKWLRSETGVARMATEIKAWQIIDGQLTEIATSLSNEGRTEAKDLEDWLANNPSILGDDVALIGRQVQTRTGSIDLLGIDRSGDLS